MRVRWKMPGRFLEGILDHAGISSGRAGEPIICLLLAIPWKQAIGPVHPVSTHPTLGANHAARPALFSGFLTPASAVFARQGYLAACSACHSVGH
jgi:hypothetical protein